MSARRVGLALLLALSVAFPARTLGAEASAEAEALRLPKSCLLRTAAHLQPDRRAEKAELLRRWTEAEGRIGELERERNLVRPIVAAIEAEIEARTIGTASAGYNPWLNPVCVRISEEDARGLLEALEAAKENQ